MPGSPLLVFHDTSVLINFFRPGLTPVLGKLFGERVCWSATIRRECERNERRLALPGLTAAADELLGEPILPEAGEQLAIRQLRTLMAKPGDHPDQHLGEAETITIIQQRHLDALIAIDDNDAGHWAAPVRSVNTWRLIKLARRRGDASLDDAGLLRQKFVDSGGHMPYEIGTPMLFRQWVDGDW